MEITKTRTGYIAIIDGQTITINKTKVTRGQRYDVFAGDTRLGMIYCKPNGASWWSAKPGQRTLGLPTRFENAVAALVD